jgi:hypothetical protein
MILISLPFHVTSFFFVLREGQTEPDLAHLRIFDWAYLSLSPFHGAYRPHMALDRTFQIDDPSRQGDKKNPSLKEAFISPLRVLGNCKSDWHSLLMRMEGENTAR